ncbi:TetR/AcrR family transcriptional regulator [Subtercola sp. Z020]|uniref:TetR/AcrR family transcriptional regulator n=1 Tax=Subtercola sp. Z020 TaxID=2080582 RepID=UPI00130DEC23|nr:TetR/AcrR family transcriptional regulator [Subtercola sp. Z020]
MTSRSYSSVQRRQTAALTRESVLDAAERLFAEQGYQATTLVSIAAEARVAVTTVYGSVGNKAEIVVAMLRRGMAEPSIEETIRRVEGATSARDAISEMSRGICSTIQKLLPLVNIMYDTAPTDPVIAATVREIEETYRHNLTPLVSMLERNGWLGPQLSPDVALDILWFHFGIPPLRTVAELGWAWPTTEIWLADQVAYALLRQPA